MHHQHYILPKLERCMVVLVAQEIGGLAWKGIAERGGSVAGTLQQPRVWCSPRLFGVCLAYDEELIVYAHDRVYVMVAFYML